MKTAREARIHLASDVSSLGEGRRFVARTLREWQVDEARIEPVQLVATELVANAIVHAGSAPVLSLGADGPDLVLRVADDSPSLPAARAVTTSGAGGRGLLIVDALGDRWGVDTTTAGKAVWVVFSAAFR